MRLSTMKGIAVGSLMGMTVGAGLMMTPQGKLRRALRLLERGKALSNVRFSDAQSSFYAWSSAFVIAFKNAKLSLELHGFLRLLPF